MLPLGAPFLRPWSVLISFYLILTPVIDELGARSWPVRQSNGSTNLHNINWRSLQQASGSSLYLAHPVSPAPVQVIMSGERRAGDSMGLSRTQLQPRTLELRVMALTIFGIECDTDTSVTQIGHGTVPDGVTVSIRQ
jgi:hypothetical protein